MAHEFSSTKVSANKASTRDDRLPGKRQPKFVYAHSPFNWEFTNGGWLPRLTKIPLLHGVNGCLAGPGGHEPVLTRLRSDGWTVIDEGGAIMVSGPEGTVIEDEGYLCEAKGRGGMTYFDAWTHPIVVGQGRNAVVDYTTSYDRAGWRAWRQSLVEDGRIGPPSPAVVAQIIRRQERRAGRRLGESHDGNPHIQKHVGDEMAKADAMRASLDTPPRTAARPATSTPKRRKVSRGT